MDASSSRAFQRLFLTPLLVGAVQQIPAAAQTSPPPPTSVPGHNVNLVSGPAVLDLTASPPIIKGDYLRKQQNEGSCAFSSRNPKNILCGGNDYRLVDVPGVDPNLVTRDAWLGVFQSADGGDMWESTVHDGHFIDPKPSVLKGFQAGADVTVRSGAAGIAYYTGIVFTRGATANTKLGLLFVSTWLDLANKEDDRMPFKMVRPPVVVAMGKASQFVDKPWSIVGEPEGTATCTITVPGTSIEQTIPDTPLYIGYTVFLQANDGDPTEGTSRGMLVKVTKCGTKVSTPVAVTQSNAINQGFAIAKRHNTGQLLAVWRRFKSGTQTDAILATTSIDHGRTWSRPIVVADPICPFEQPTSSTAARINTFPSATADPLWFHVAWSDRGKTAGKCNTAALNPPARSRTVVSSSLLGVGWTTPKVVDPVPGNSDQITPSIVFGGGQVHLLWKDFRDTASHYFEDPYLNEKCLVVAAAVASVPGYPVPPDCAASLPAAIHNTRAFVVIVRNDSGLNKTFHLTIANQPAGGVASFNERPPVVTSLTAQVPPKSSVERTVFLIPNKNANPRWTPGPACAWT